jgi:hypothetical protein
MMKGWVHRTDLPRGDGVADRLCNFWFVEHPNIAVIFASFDVPTLFSLLSCLMFHPLSPHSAL